MGPLGAVCYTVCFKSTACQQSETDCSRMLLVCCQGLTHAQVTFKNETTGEHSFYELKYTCSAPPSRGNLSLECPVRTQTSTHVSLANPLDVPVTLKATISSKQVGSSVNLACN
jgi:hypothetical protein